MIFDTKGLTVERGNDEVAHRIEGKHLGRTEGESAGKTDLLLGLDEVCSHNLDLITYRRYHVVRRVQRTGAEDEAVVVGHRGGQRGQSPAGQGVWQ